LVFSDEARVSIVSMARKRKIGRRPRIFAIKMLDEDKEVDDPLNAMQQSKKDSHKLVLVDIGEKKKGLINVESLTKVIIGRMG